MARLLALLSLCVAVAAQEQQWPGHAPVRSLLSAPAGPALPAITPIRADYEGTTFFSSAPCSNKLTCSPASCVANR